MAIVKVTKDNFESEVIQSDKKVLIDFYADWCGPCRMLAPIVEKVAEESDKVKVCKVNVDEEPELARKFNVMSIPLLVSMENGKVAGTSLGYQPLESVKALLKI